MSRTAFALPPSLITVIVAVLMGAALGGLAALSAPLAVGAALGLVGASLVLATKARNFTVGALYLLIVMIVFTSAIPRGRFLPIFAPNEVALLMILGLALLYVLVHRPVSPLPGALIAAVSFLVVGTSLLPLLSYPLRGSDLAVSSVLELVAPLQYLGLLWLFATVPRKLPEKRRLIQVLIFCASIAALIGLLQAINFGPVVSFLQAWYPSNQQVEAAEAARVTSVFAAWNALGLFLVVNLLLIVAIYPDEQKSLYVWNMRIATVLLLSCLIATNLYSGLIAFVLGFILIKLLDPRGLKLAFGFAVLGAMGAVVQLPAILRRLSYQLQTDSLLPQTLEYRLRIWQEVFFPRIAEHLWWGVSPDFSGLRFGFPESQYIFLLFRSGLTSLIAYFVWLVILLFWLWYRYKRMEPSFERGLVIVAFVQLVTFSLVGFINPVFTYSGSIDILWMVLGLVASTRLKGSTWLEPE